MYGLSGSSKPFLDELQVSLRSVLLNHPIHQPLQIHFLADQRAYDALPQLLQPLKYWRTLHPITIHAYNVQEHLPRWEKEYIRPAIKNMEYTHTVGSFFRLFAYEILHPSVQHVIYMDSDVLIMAHLDELWRHRDPNVWFQWGPDQVAGFTILNIWKYRHIWGMLRDVNLREYAKRKKHNMGDQLILRLVNETHPKLVGSLPLEWDNSRTAYWEHVEERRPNGVGMLHFNGGGDSTAFAETKPNKVWIYSNEHMQGWGLARYYAQMTWGWAQFIVESRRLGDGFPIRILYHEHVTPHIVSS